MNETVEEWFRKASNDFNNAKKLLDSADDETYDLICFLCQQSIEKLLKALLIQKGQPIDKIHNLDKLGVQAKEHYPDLDVNLNRLKTLSTIGIMSRYPEYDATVDEAAQAFKTAQEIRNQLVKYFE